jgi:hypothetical protein
VKPIFSLIILAFGPFAAFAGSLTVSGFSSGGFMASQLAAIYSQQYDGVASVAGGVFFCAENGYQKNLKAYGNAGLFYYGVDSNMVYKSIGMNPLKSSNDQFLVPLPTNPLYQSISVCMERPEGAHQPATLDDGRHRLMNLNFLKTLESQHLIDPVQNIARQRIFIYQGKYDSAERPEMANKLIEFYFRLGVPRSALKAIAGEGNHNFPTIRSDGIDCKAARFPYIANCAYDLAGDLLSHTLGRPLKRGKFNVRNLRRIQQDGAPKSLAPYGYFYANPFCLANPGACDLHVALHGCEMADDFDPNFQQLYESKLQLTHAVAMTNLEMEARHPRMGGLSFARRGGYAEYAEDPANRLMILFPQTQITASSFPANPQGCWDWFGYTGEDYATNRGAEPRWLNAFIQRVRANPQSILTKELGPHELDAF